MRILELVSVSCVLGLAMHHVLVFFLALTNGNEILLTINDYGEKWIEAVLFPIFIVLGAVSLVRMARRTTVKMCPQCMANRRQVPMAKEGSFWRCHMPDCGHTEPAESCRKNHFRRSRSSSSQQGYSE